MAPYLTLTLPPHHGSLCAPAGAAALSCCPALGLGAPPPSTPPWWCPLVLGIPVIICQWVTSFGCCLSVGVRVRLLGSVFEFQTPLEMRCGFAILLFHQIRYNLLHSVILVPLLFLWICCNPSFCAPVFCCCQWVTDLLLSVGDGCCSCQWVTSFGCCLSVGVRVRLLGSVFEFQTPLEMRCGFAILLFHQIRYNLLHSVILVPLLFFWICCNPSFFFPTDPTDNCPLGLARWVLVQ